MTPWYKSKQFYFNVLTVVIATAAAFGFQDFQADPATMIIAQLVIAVVNVGLRFVFPSKPPPELARTKGISDFQAPRPSYHRANSTAAVAFSVVTLTIATALVLTL